MVDKIIPKSAGSLKEISNGMTFSFMNYLHAVQAHIWKEQKNDTILTKISKFNSQQQSAETGGECKIELLPNSITISFTNALRATTK